MVLVYLAITFVKLAAYHQRVVKFAEAIEFYLIVPALQDILILMLLTVVNVAINALHVYNLLVIVKLAQV